jgi:hypothetical protein
MPLTVKNIIKTLKNHRKAIKLKWHYAHPKVYSAWIGKGPKNNILPYFFSIL